MALVLKDRVRQTSTTAGTGTITLSGSVTGFQGFSVIGSGNTTYYTIADQSGANWEVGLGTYTSPNQLSRDTVYESSNSNNLVSFTSGTKDVFVTFPAEAVTTGTVTSVSGSGSVSGITLSGTVTSTGSLTLGGSLNLSSPPAIGGTTPAAITGTTVTAWDQAGTGTPGSFVIYDPITTGITATFTIDPATYSPTISATDGTNNFPLQLNNGVTFPIGVNLDIGRTNALVLSDSVGLSINVKPPTSIISTYNFILPTTAGSNTQVLKTDGSGNLSWTYTQVGNTPVTITTATYTVAATDSWLIANRAGTVTLTLPTASSFTGRIITVKTITANTVVSASSNVVPLAGGAAGTAILAATAGKWAKLVSDGTNWIIMEGA